MRRASLSVVVAVCVFSCTYDIPDIASNDSGLTQTDGPADNVAYNDITDKQNWTLFETKSVATPASGVAQYYAGGTFDGQYLYLAPTWGEGTPASSVVLQYNTHGSTDGSAFADADAGAWVPFDTTTKSTQAAGFSGAVFDGAYVYFAPYTADSSSTPAADGVVVRYTASSTFNNGNSWVGFDTTTLKTGSSGFSGATFDGRYVYFVPQGTTTISGLVARFDTAQGSPQAGSFATKSAWSFFDATGIDPSAAGFIGAVYDGRYVTFVPNYSTLAVRYDTQASFSATASWAKLDVSTVSGADPQSAFAGGVFDGKYIYLVPNFATGSTTFTFESIVVRCDPTAGFVDTACTTFDVSTVNPNAKGFFGGAFDGRYVYLVPYANGGTGGSAGPDTFQFDGIIMRYDTTLDFNKATSWSSFDTGQELGTEAVGFAGAVFDGRYLYLVPSAFTQVARFDARTPPLLPTSHDFHASFY